jgi:Flp pilus assembly pilin Flp
VAQSCPRGRAAAFMSMQPPLGESIQGGARRVKIAVGRDDGATGVEYGLLLALIAGVIVATVRMAGVAVSAMFESVIGTF